MLLLELQLRVLALLCYQQPSASGLGLAAPVAGPHALEAGPLVPACSLAPGGALPGRPAAPSRTDKRNKYTVKLLNNLATRSKPAGTVLIKWSRLDNKEHLFLWQFYRLRHQQLTSFSFHKLSPVVTASVDSVGQYIPIAMIYYNNCCSEACVFCCCN